jgi:hypothetical protein
MKIFVIPFNDKWLDIGSSYSNLHIDTSEWLNNYSNNWIFKYDSYHHTYVLIFDNDDEYLHFLLRWS